MLLFEAKRLAALMTDTLAERGVHPESVQHVVSSLIETSLRGVDSHGINLFPHYCREVEAGRINKKPFMQTTQTAASVLTMDADHAFGHHAGAVAMDKAMELAQKTGMGSISVKNSSHFGAAAYFGLRAARRGYLGFAFTNADALVKAYGSKKPFFGTNPICFTAPMTGEDPFCLDMATSFISWNKIHLYRQNNQSIPPHWAFDENGQTVTDPHKAKTLNPAGEYKGFGLGAMVDILCGLLANGPLSPDILPMYTSPIHAKRHINHFFMALDISKFTDLETFKERLKEMGERIRQLDPLVPGDAVMMAGDPEKTTYKQRLISGIPVSEVKYNEFLSLSPKFRIP